MSGDLINQEETGDQSTDAKTDQSWMLIFTDLVSLMLTFFVLLFSMSVVKVDAWNNVVSAETTLFHASTLTTDIENNNTKNVNMSETKSVNISIQL